MHRFRIAGDAAEHGRIRLQGAELRHLRDVLRLGPGAEVEIFDGRGGSWLAEVVSVSRTAAELAMVRAVERRTESTLALSLAVAISKGPKLDWVVEKATELGVSRIVPFTSERTIPTRERVAARVGRWRRIAAAAAAQSGRSVCPEIGEVEELHHVLERCSSHDRSVLCWEESDASSPFGASQTTRTALVITGPEGGFSADEARAARAAGCTTARLGPRILRAETAAVVAVALVQFLWGDLDRAR